MITHEQIINGLAQLGFVSGWSVVSTTITQWENDEPQPSERELIEAAKLFVSEKNARQVENVAIRASALAKLAALGLTEEEIKAIVGGV